MYLDLPTGVDFNTEEGFEKLMPSDFGINGFQDIQKETMLAQFEDSKEEGYDWPADHHGSIWPQEFRGKVLLKETNPNDGNYCCGVTFENAFLSMKEWMGEHIFESEGDLTYQQMLQVRTHFFRVKEQHYRGAGSGVLYWGKKLKERWKAAQEKDPEEYEDSFDDAIGLSFRYHTDPYKAVFGAYVQMQPHEDAMKGGHAAIFLGLEKRKHKGEVRDCIRVFHSSTRHDYGITNSGVGAAWYLIGKKDDQGFERIFHFGEIAPID